MISRAKAALARIDAGRAAGQAGQQDAALAPEAPLDDKHDKPVCCRHGQSLVPHPHWQLLGVLGYVLFGAEAGLAGRDRPSPTSEGALSPAFAGPAARLTSSMRLPFFYGWVICCCGLRQHGHRRQRPHRLFLACFRPSSFSPARSARRGRRAPSRLASWSWLFQSVDRRLHGPSGPRLVMESGRRLTGAGPAAGAPPRKEPWHLYLTLGVLVGGGSVCLGYSGQSPVPPNWLVRRRGLAIWDCLCRCRHRLDHAAARRRKLVIERAGWRSACLALAALVLLRVGAHQSRCLGQAPGRHGADAGRRPSQRAQADAAGAGVKHRRWARLGRGRLDACPCARHPAASGGSRSAIFAALYAWYAVPADNFSQVPCSYRLQVPALPPGPWGSWSFAGLPAEEIA